MRFHPENNWFWSGELVRAVAEIHRRATQDHTHWLSSAGVPVPLNCKYVQIRIDQRTGDFILQDNNGQMLFHDEVYALFPALQDDVKFVSVGARPYPE